VRTRIAGRKEGRYCTKLLQAITKQTASIVLLGSKNNVIIEIGELESAAQLSSFHRKLLFLFCGLYLLL